MKILLIRIKNLNSLKCENNQILTIDLQLPPLAGAGLFLITGNTGAGKSTILDAITLALFGKIARSSETIKEKVLSFGETEALAELEFETNNGQQYRAKWQLNSRFVKAKKGKADYYEYTSKREIASLPEGKLLTDKSNQVQEQIQALLEGLTYEQFTRSVMLAQGEFSKFLKDGDKKSEILERITNTAIYSQLSTAAFQKHKEEKLIYEKYQQEQETRGNQLLAPEIEAQLNEELQNLAPAVAEYAQNQDEISQQINEIKLFNTLQTEKNEQQQALNVLQTDLEIRRADLDRLNLHNEAKKYADLLQLFDKENDAHNLAYQQLQKSEEILPALRQQPLLLAQTLADIIQKSTQAQANFSLQLPLWEQMQGLDVEIKTLANQIQSLPIAAKTELLIQKNQQLAQAQQFAQTLNDTQAQISQRWQKAQIYAPLFDTEKFNQLKFDIQNLQQQLKIQTNASAEIAKISLQLQHNDRNQADISQQYNTCSQKRQELWREYNDYLLRYNLPFDDYQFQQTDLLNNQLQENSEFLADIERLKTLINQLNTLSEQINELQNIADSTENERVESCKNLLTLSEQHQHQQQTLAIWERQQQKIKYILQLQTHLQHDETCPVCGSAEKPFLALGQEISREYTQKLTSLEKEESQLRQATVTIEKNYLQIQAQIQAQTIAQLKSEQAINQTYTQLLSAEKQIYTLLQRCALRIDSKDLSEKRLNQLQNQFQIRTAELKNVIARQPIWQNSQNYYNNEIARFENILNQLKQASSEAHRQLNSQEQQLIETQNDSHELAQQLAQTLQSWGFNFDINELNPLVKRLDKLQKEFFVLKAEFASILPQQTQAQQAIELAAQAQTQAKTVLDELQTQAQNIDTAIKNLVQTRQQLGVETNPTAAIQSSRKNLELFTQQSHAAEKHLHAAQTELLIAEQNHSHLLVKREKTEQQLYEFERLLANICAETDFINSQNLRAAILPQPKADDIADFVQTQTSKIIALRNNISTLQTKIDSKSDYFVENTATENELQTQLQTLKANVSQLLTRKGNIEQQLLAHQQQTAQLQTLIQATAAQKIVLNRWEELNELIGQADGQKFSRYAQSLTLSRLVYLANKHLLRLIEGRYQLARSKSKDLKNILELDIIDRFQSDNQRSLDTLSGGESFLASLALALALSDLASGKMKIQSLFIDEGFGTLDADTLNIAVQVLQSLQAQGKTIGIISHVEQLQQQISTQIRVFQKGSGVSGIEISC